MVDLLQVVADNIGLVASILGILGAVWGVIKFLKSNNPWIKRRRYYLFNKVIRINIGAAKDYPAFQADVQEIRNVIVEAFSKLGRTARVEAAGKNYLMILIDGFQAPFKVEFQPRSDLDEGDDEEPNETGPDAIEVRVKLVGTIKFYYREDENNKDYLNAIDTIFGAIEKENQVIAEYVNYHLVSTPMPTFTYDWSEAENKDEREAKVVIGKALVEVNSRSINCLYDAYKKHITGV